MTGTVSSAEGGVVRPANEAGIFWPLGFVSVLLFVPSAIRYLLGTSSNTFGLVAACLLLCGAALSRNGFQQGSYARWASGTMLALIFVLVVHLGIAIFIPRVPQPIDTGRTIASLLALFVIGMTAGVAADWLLTMPSRQMDRIGHIIRIALLIIGIWCFVGGQPPSPLTLARPSFPFTEPSHYALIAAPFIIDGCVRTTLPRRIVWLLVWLAMGLLNQSLSLLVAVLVAAMVSLPLIYALIASIPVALALGGMDLQYYVDRLDFSGNSNNLSSLVYRQGWELLQQGILYSKGWGIGFQQLGFTPLNVPTSDIIYRILGDDSNLRDGSFVAAKLISELGVAGLGLAGISVVLAIRATLILRQLVAIPIGSQPANLRFACAMICAFTIEMFVRGIGYFSTTVILFVAAWLVLRTAKQQSRLT